MTNAQPTRTHSWSVMGQAELPPSVLFGETELDLWPYRVRTVALLRRYARASVEVGRLPSLLGREFFRSRVTSYSMGNFEDIVIFVTDMERTIEKLDALEKKLVAMHVLEEYTFSEISRLLGCSERTVERLLHEAIDQLSRILLIRGLLEKLPEATRGVAPTTQTDYSDQKSYMGRVLECSESCQEGKNCKTSVSCSKQGENKCRKTVGLPPSNLIS